MITRDIYNFPQSHDYIGYSVTWGTSNDKSSLTYAIGGRSGCKCSGIHVYQPSSDFNIRVIPKTSLFTDSANICITIPSKEDVIADIVTVFLGMLDSVESKEMDTSFDDYIKEAETKATNTLSDVDVYAEFLALPKDEFLRSNRHITRFMYSLLNAELGGRLKQLSSTQGSDMLRLFVASFITDKDKMADFADLSKEEFLASYSYLTEAEYDATTKLVDWLLEILEKVLSKRFVGYLHG